MSTNWLPIEDFLVEALRGHQDVAEASVATSGSPCVVLRFRDGRRFNLHCEDFAESFAPHPMRAVRRGVRGRSRRR